MADSSPIMGEGSVNAVMAAESKLNITHEPIPALGWPAMTMDLKVAQELSLDELQPGTRIHFILQKEGQYNYVISDIHAMPAAHEGAQP